MRQRVKSLVLEGELELAIIFKHKFLLLLKKSLVQTVIEKKSLFNFLDKNLGGNQSIVDFLYPCHVECRCKSKLYSITLYVYSKNIPLPYIREVGCVYWLGIDIEMELKFKINLSELLIYWMHNIDMLIF